MKNGMKNRNIIFSNWKKFFLPVAFGVYSVGLFAPGVLAVMAAAAEIFFAPAVWGCEKVQAATAS
ncbi:MAG: hypothetical protein Q4G07_10745 [Oscillospiraceae bacterium]|nr:hypothetical protein [Oscillospiraceae bacterium]